MSSKANFKQLTLVHSMHLIFKMQSFPKLICSTFLITSCISAACAQEQLTDTSNNKTVDQQSLNQVKSDQSTEDTSTVLSSSTNQSLANQAEQDSLLALKQQEQSNNQINELKPIQLDDNLENLPVIPVDQTMANEIFREAENAKNEAQAYRESTSKNPPTVVKDISPPEPLP